MTHDPGPLAFTTYELDGHVALVTINRPEVLNALHRGVDEELARVWDCFQADPDAWVAILTGAGERGFCAGSDLKEAAGDPRRPIWELHGAPGGFGGLVQRFDLLKPVIAAVNGHAIGGGIDLVLACDIAVAAEHATFAMPEARVGVPAGFGGLERLVRQIPEKLAMELVLTGRRFSAEEALRAGLVNKVVPADELLAAAREYAELICKSSPLAIQAARQVALAARDVPLEVACGRVLGKTVELWRSEDIEEGSRAFAERRDPQWKGR
jgi:crotonobetainyl-CoA hydratase